ncbi:MAG TPA: hypothetical protein VI855_03605 [Dehalococcoidia bacterium]|nr:hypothetical protein [Dehalococcoidia bacterium]
MLSAQGQHELKELLRLSTVALQPKGAPVMAGGKAAPKREVRYTRQAKEALRKYQIQLNGWDPSQDGEEATAAEFIALGRRFRLTEGAETPANAAESGDRFHGCDPEGILVEFDPTAIQLPAELEDENIWSQEGDRDAAADGAAEFESQLRALQEQVKALETEAAVAAQLRQRIKELEAQAEQSSHTEASAPQETGPRQGDAEREQGALGQADEETARMQREIQHMQRALAQWEQWGANAQSVVQSLFTEVEELRPLKARAGHQCPGSKPGSFDHPASVGRVEAKRRIETLQGGVDFDTPSATQSTPA